MEKTGDAFDKIQLGYHANVEATNVKKIGEGKGFANAMKKAATVVVAFLTGRLAEIGGNYFVVSAEALVTFKKNNPKSEMSGIRNKPVIEQLKLQTLVRELAVIDKKIAENTPIDEKTIAAFFRKITLSNVDTYIENFNHAENNDQKQKIIQEVLNTSPKLRDRLFTSTQIDISRIEFTKGEKDYWNPANKKIELKQKYGFPHANKPTVASPSTTSASTKKPLNELLERIPDVVQTYLKICENKQSKPNYDLAVQFMLEQLHDQILDTKDITPLVKAFKTEFDKSVLFQTVVPPTTTSQKTDTKTKTHLKSKHIPLPPQIQDKNKKVSAFPIAPKPKIKKEATATEKKGILLRLNAKAVKQDALWLPGHQKQYAQLKRQLWDTVLSYKKHLSMGSPSDELYKEAIHLAEEILAGPPKITQKPLSQLTRQLPAFEQLYLSKEELLAFEKAVNEFNKAFFSMEQPAQASMTTSNKTDTVTTHKTTSSTAATTTPKSLDELKQLLPDLVKKYKTHALKSEKTTLTPKAAIKYIEKKLSGQIAKTDKFAFREAIKTEYYHNW